MGSSKDKNAPPPYSEHLTRTSSQLPASAFSDGRSSALSPPAINQNTLLPYTFTVGAGDVAPFVSVPEMILHLLLLAAFDRLQQLVRTTRESTGEVLDGDTRWSVFCMRAEKNFEGWVNKLYGTEVKHAVQLDERMGWPSLDVVMIWHSYVLNPRRFYKAYPARRFRVSIRACEAMTLLTQTRFIDPLTFGYDLPSEERQPPASTSLPFPSHPDLSTFELPCPQCSTINHVPWLRPPATPQGYCQKDFQYLYKDTPCGLLITHETLRVFKACQDLVAVFDGQQNFLPGMGLMPTTGELTRKTAETVSWAIVTVFKTAFDQAVLKPLFSMETLRHLFSSDPTPAVIVPFTPSNLAKHVLDWKFATFEQILDKNIATGVLARLCTGIPGFRKIAFRQRMSRMYAAYDHSGIASLALGPAVMRQGNFIGKMKSMGWLQPGRFEGGEGQAFLLQKAAARYHAFLDLMTTMPSGFLCPTLDIDLAWHTHQLKAEQYRVDTLHITAPIIRFIDHDDKVSDVKLGDAYDLTSRAWLARFKVPYSQCGCHQGDLAAIDSGFAAAIPDRLKFWDRSKDESKTDKRRRAIEKLIEGMEQGEKDASHPSVHNLVSVSIRAHEAARAARLRKIQKLHRRAEKLNSTTSPEQEKDWRLKRSLTKDLAHLDPFVQDLPTPAYTRNNGATVTHNGATGAVGHTSKVLPYWGVALGGGALALGGGAAVAWGLAVEDPHCLTEEDCRRGACAAGAGAGGSGYCGGGGVGACKSWTEDEAALDGAACQVVGLLMEVLVVAEVMGEALEVVVGAAVEGEGEAEEEAAGEAEEGHSQQ